MSEAVTLREIDDENFEAIIKLDTTMSESQRRCVAPNVRSIAQGALSPCAWFRAVYLGETPVGFVMVDLHPPADEFPADDLPAGFLWRFMIGGPWQKNGVGWDVLNQLIGFFRREGVRTLYTSCDTEEQHNPYGFYTRYGFTDTGRDDDGERVLRFVIDDSGAAQAAEASERPPEPVRGPGTSPVFPKLALVTIWTDQVEPMKRFYHDVLGFLVKTDLGGYVEFENQGARFAVCQRSAMNGLLPDTEEFTKRPVGQRFELAFPCETPQAV
ncbi:MAG: GNAT family N-acetyltransferase, partial [Spirochaetaceae bacterium]